MVRVRQLIFVGSILVLSWLAMMAIHEFGHMVAAVVTGGNVTRVVLHPLAISRTDVSPNPSPLAVVWLGPILGSIVPITIWLLVPRRFGVARKIAMFFAGFALVANGAYIGLGAFDGVGDCGVMLENGSPLWTLLAFGMLSMSIGGYVWHRLGSLADFLSSPSNIGARLAYGSLVIAISVVLLEWVLSPVG